MSKLVYLNQLQDATYESLTAADFTIGVIDKDDANLTSTEIDSLQATGKKLISYVSIGEAEEYRDYWTKNNWEENSPDFVLDSNALWAENHLVKFWDQEWKDLVKEEISEIVSAGYNGMYMDLVEVYQVEAVEEAYAKENPNGDVRQEMADFVIELSAYAKSLNSNFEVIANNGSDLLCTNPWDASDPNEAYITAIDGMGKEDVWYFNDQVLVQTDVAAELARVKLATDAGKYVIAIDYPTEAAKQETFVSNSVTEGFIPFVGKLDLGASIAAINYTIAGQVPQPTIDMIG